MAQTTALTAAITTTGATSCAVTAGKCGAPFGVIQIDSEQMWVSAGLAGTGLTIVRGINGTTAATHLNGATVTIFDPLMQGALNGAINNSVASLVVFSAQMFPASDTFYIQIDSEQMKVGLVSGSTFTVTRGVNGTSAASHSSGAPVVLIYFSNAWTPLANIISSVPAAASVNFGGATGRSYPTWPMCHVPFWEQGGESAAPIAADSWLTLDQSGVMSGVQELASVDYAGAMVSIFWRPTMRWCWSGFTDAGGSWATPPLFRKADPRYLVVIRGPGPEDKEATEPVIPPYGGSPAYNALVLDRVSAQ